MKRLLGLALLLLLASLVSHANAQTFQAFNWNEAKGPHLVDGTMKFGWTAGVTQAAVNTSCGTVVNQIGINTSGHPETFWGTTTVQNTLTECIYSTQNQGVQHFGVVTMGCQVSTFNASIPGSGFQYQGATLSNGSICGSCPANTTYNATTNSCEANPTCPAGQHMWNGGCVADCSAAGSTVAGVSGAQYSGSGAAPANACINGCQLQWGTVVGIPGPPAEWFGWPGISTGATCATGTGTAAASACPTGQCPGTVNGSTTCLPCSQNPAATTTQNTAATTSQTQTDGAGTTTGTSSTTTSTTNVTNNNQTTTTTTTTVAQFDGAGNPTGSTTTTSTELKPVDEFCKLNPSATICKTSSFGGSCSAGFACEGDATECAIAKEVYARNCELENALPAQEAEGAAALQGNDQGTLQNPAALNNRTTVAMPTLDQSAWLAGGAGLADQVVEIPHADPLTIPWSKLNDYLGYMGLIVVAFALVFGARMVAEAL